MRKIEKNTDSISVTDSIAHDLNNLLTVISLNIYAIKESSGSRHEKKLSNIEKALDLSRTMIKSLSSKTNSHKEILQFEDVIFRICDIVSSATDSDIILDFNESIGLPCDSALDLERVFFNLIWNALEAVKGRDRGFVKISYQLCDGKVAVKIKDNGVGIKTEALDKIFSSGYSTKESGRGKGLCICREITERSGGTIEVDSVEGEGSEFRVILPF